MPTQYIWVVFEPCCHLLPEHGEMVLHLLLVVVETLPVCVCVVCVVCVWCVWVGRTSSQFRLATDNKVQLVKAHHVFPTASQK